MTTTTDYATMLHRLAFDAAQAAEVEGADSVGAFHPIPRTGTSRAYGEFSSLADFLAAFAEVLGEFLADDGDEIEGWEA